MSLEIGLADDGKLTISRGRGSHRVVARETRKFFLARRPARRGARGAYPETTNRDVRQLAEVWRHVFRAALSGDLDLPIASKERWDADQRAIDRHLFASFDHEPFAANEAFWFTWTSKPSIWAVGHARSAVALGHGRRRGQADNRPPPEALADRAGDVASAAATMAVVPGGMGARPRRCAGRRLGCSASSRPRC